MPTSWAYFDTSVLVKRYVREEGSSEARRLLKNYRILTSAIAPTEAISALSRRRTLGELAAKQFGDILSRMRADYAYWELVEVNAVVLKEAEKIILKTDLRTLDSIYLASILIFQAASGIQIPIMTGDTKQRAAAVHLGLETVWVG